MRLLYSAPLIPGFVPFMTVNYCSYHVIILKVLHYLLFHNEYLNLLLLRMAYDQSPSKGKSLTLKAPKLEITFLNSASFPQDKQESTSLPVLQFS